MQYGIGPTTVRVDHGLLVHAPNVYLVGILAQLFAKLGCALSDLAIILHPRSSSASLTIEGKRGYHGNN